MGKQIIFISTSLRKGGNSEALVDEFMKGASDAGNNVDKISLYGKNIGFCKGCLACQKNMKCVISDDVSAIIEKMLNADVIVFATPIYFYEMAGQMKTLLDRTNPMFPAKYKFKDIYLLAAAADESESSMDGAIKGLQGWISCFDGAKLAGVVKGLGVNEVGSIKNSIDILEESYNMGMNA